MHVLYMGLDTKIVYTRYFTQFHGLPTYAYVSSWVYITTYMHVHKKYACRTDMQLATSFSKTVNTGLSYVGK